MKDIPIVDFDSGAFDPAKVQVRRIRGRETISRLFEFEVHLVCSDPAGIDPQALLTTPASIVVKRKSSRDGQVHEQRRIFGMVCSVLDRLVVGARHTEYTVKFVPRAWQSTLTTITDIYMDMTLPEIIEKKLQQSARLSPGDDVEFRLMGTYDKREFIVQYRETDMDFISRLTEDVGIFFFFEHRGGKEVMVFADDNSHFQPTEPATVPLGSRGDETNVYDLDVEHRLVPTNFQQRDYNYRNPGMDVMGEAAAPYLGTGLRDEFGSHLKTPDEATHTALVRAQEEGWQSKVYVGKGEEPGIRSGGVVTLEGHTSGDLELVLVEVEHWAVQPAFGMGESEEESYTNQFRAITKDTPYRPPRRTPKPVVPGVVTGLVEAESDTEMGAIDDQGRYRVSFLYDAITGRDKGKASRPLRMAQPSAGADRGFHLPLKPGTEVIITCVNGDPDRPIIAGAVPNPRTGSPVTAATAEKSGMRTNKSEWFIDDAQPRFKLAVDGEVNVFQVGAPNAAAEGITSATETSWTTIANDTSSIITHHNNTFNTMMTLMASDNIVQFAGAPNPFDKWEKGQAIAKWGEDYVKTMRGLADSPYKIKQAKDDQAQKKAEDAQKKADEAYKKQQKECAKKAGATYPSSGKTEDMQKAGVGVHTNDDGTTRWQTEDEFYAQACKDKASPDCKKKLQQKADAAAKAKKEAEAKKKAAEKTKADFEKSKSKTANVIQAAAGAVINASGTLLNVLSKLYSIAAKEANVALVEGVHKIARGEAAASTERTAANLGNPDKPWHILGSVDSAVLYGVNNAFVYSPAHATLASMAFTNVVGGDAVHIKSPNLIEAAAAKTVQLTGTKEVDVWTSDDLKLIAHPGGREAKIDGANSVWIRGKKNVFVESTDEDIRGIAKKKVVFDAQDESFHAHGKQTATLVAGSGSGMGLKATEKKLELGKISGSADKPESPSPDAKNQLCVEDGIIKLATKKVQLELAKNGDLKGSAKGKLKLDTKKKAEIKAKSDVNIKCKKFKAKGKKVMLA